WYSAWPLLILWALGLGCGVVLPFGLLLAAIDLTVLTWASVAVGLYLAIRPGTTSAASSRSAFSTLVLFIVHAPLLWAALISPRELATLTSLDFRQRWALVLSAMAASTLTGAIAWFLTRRTLARFDEWVGRPVAGARGRNQ